MRHYFIAAAALTSLSLAANAQTPAAKLADSARVEIDAATTTSDTARLGKAIVLLDRALVTYPNDPYLLHYRGYAYYRQVNEAFRQNNPSAAAGLINHAMTDLSASSAKLQWGETYALLSTLTGMQISLDMSQIQTLGPQVFAYRDQALAAGPDNPRVLYLIASLTYRTPPEYGGGLEAARPLLVRAIEAFKAEKPAALAPTWGLTEALAFQKEIGG